MGFFFFQVGICDLRKFSVRDALLPEQRGGPRARELAGPPQGQERDGCWDEPADRGGRHERHGTRIFCFVNILIK